MDSDMMNGMPMMARLMEPHDALKDGLTNAKAQLAPRHPVEQMQQERRVKEKNARIKDLTAQQGIAAAMRFQADQKILSSYYRLPGLESSFAGLESYTGADERLSFDDWLGAPEDSSQYLCNLHATMEHKLNMQ